MSRGICRPDRVESIANGLVLIGVAGAVLGLLIIRAPGWGLMDDALNLRIAADFFSEGGGLRAFWSRSVADMQSWGMLRPVYWLWVLTVYSVFADSPLGAYLMNATLVIAAMVAWGFAFDALFVRHRIPSSRTRLLYPTLLLLFPPFWSLFMYLSLQEKFVVLLAGVASLSYARSLEPTGRTSWVTIGWLSILLGVLGKPTMIALPLAIIAVSLLGMIPGWQRDRHRAWVISSIVFISAYAGFTLNYQSGSYTSTYGSGFSPAGLLGALSAVPLTVQALAALGALTGALLLALPFPAQRRSVDPALILPASMLAYLAVLAPWGFPTYLLSAVAPFFAGSLLILLHVLQQRVRVLRNGALVTLSAVGLLLSVFFLDINPKSIWLTDTRQMQIAITSAAERGGTFYLPPPFIEHASSLRALTKADVRYLSVGELTLEDLEEDGFLIAYLDQSKIVLRDVALGTPLHESGSWRIIPVFPEPGRTDEFSGDFESPSIPLGRRVRMLLNR